MQTPNIHESIQVAATNIHFNAMWLRKMAAAFATTGNDLMRRNLESIAAAIEVDIKNVEDAYAKDINHQVNASLKAFDDTMQAAFGKKG